MCLSYHSYKHPDVRDLLCCDYYGTNMAVTMGSNEKSCFKYYA